jgi:hypothetical protein
MNTVHQGLKDYVLSNFTDENEQRQTYDNYAIDYLTERIESILINLKDLDDAVEFVRQVEKCLDEFEGVY